MAWLYLIIAGLIEVGWALGLKASQGFTRPGVSILTVAGMILSFVLLSQAMKTLPVGTAYTVWTGIGAVGTVIFGILFFGESQNIYRLLCIGLIVLGVIGLKVLGSEN
jgi:quaternary ammonium compound-resistance protein SugE